MLRSQFLFNHLVSLPTFDLHLPIDLRSDWQKRSEMIKRHVCWTNPLLSMIEFYKKVLAFPVASLGDSQQLGYVAFL